MKKLAGTAACYHVRNSLLLDSAQSQYLSRTLGVAGNRQKWTASFWVKGGVSRATTDTFFHSFDTAAPLYRNFIRTANSILEVYVGNGTVTGLTSMALFRDEAAHYHFVVAVDTTQAVAADRVKVWQNNELLAMSGNYPAQNELTQVNGAWAHHIGTTGGSYYRDGLFSEFNFVDGLALLPSSFGYYCPLTGQWIPKKYKGSYGTNGFCLEFLDAAQLGKDTSSNGNHWTANGGIVAANQLTDTPTNNFCTLNQLDKGSGSIVSAGNLKITTPATSCGLVRASLGVASGKWYWEVKCLSSTGLETYDIGICNAFASLAGYVGNDANGWGYSGYDGKKNNNGAGSAYGATYTANDIIGVALDMDNGTITFHKNGVSQGQAFSGLSGVVFPAVSDFSLTTDSMTASVNFGQRPFTYTPPAGFKALCTLNLPRPAQRPQNIFAVVAALGSSIEATLAAARPWTNYIEIFKNRANIQSWKWRFSADAANMLSSDSQAGKTAFTAPTAADNYIGYALRVGAGYGVFSAEVAHVNGTPSNVAHGLGTNRLMAIGKIVNTTGDWYVWHPELAANQYLLLNSTAAAAAGPKITVDATNVILDSSLPSGTYRIITIAETSGCVKFGKYAGNASADGPHAACGGLPALALIKRTDGGAEPWNIFDAVRNGTNPDNDLLRPTLPDAEQDSTSTNKEIDLVSSGLKCRNTGTNGINASGGTYVYLATLKAPTKWVNAR